MIERARELLEEISLALNELDGLGLRPRLGHGALSSHAGYVFQSSIGSWHVRLLTYDDELSRLGLCGRDADD